MAEIKRIAFVPPKMLNAALKKDSSKGEGKWMRGDVWQDLSARLDSTNNRTEQLTMDARDRTG